MKKIIWQSRSNVVYEAIRSGHLPDGMKGGNAYDFLAAMALKEKFDLQPDEKAVLKKNDSYLSYWWRLARHTAQADVVVREPYPIVFGKKTYKAKTAAMIHHIDDDLARSSVRHKWFFDRLKKRLPAMDLVVTVSKYWEAYLTGLGCRRIKIIYNAFDPAEYRSVDTEGFKSKYDFKDDRPIIFIGNAHRQKGVYEAYHELKNKNYQLVMTGTENHAPDLPVKFLSLDRREYISLLHASDVVVTLSRMTEGWSRLAHEALLSRTPVIGSGTGGMKELLEGSGQPVVSDPKLLAKTLETVLQNREHYANTGFRYVEKFDKEYFNNAWVKTMEELINE